MDRFAVPQRMPHKIPSSADWSRLRPMITDLYLGQHRTMGQVCHHLNIAGYRVNTRMVRARITQWNLHRNHQLRDMAAALRLLDPDPSLWPSREPRFFIRRRPVTMKEVELFFRRKKIQNPLQWAHSTTIVREEPHVVLLEGEGEEEESSREPVSRSEQSMLSSSAPSPVTQSSPVPKQVLTLDEKAVASLQEYCSGYIGLGNMAHKEPQVHQYTIHGQFGERMRDGLAHMRRNTPDAFSHFHRGFDLIQNLLLDCHPMAIGQYLSVICFLATQKAQSILSSLLRYVARMASTLGMPSSIAEFLIAIHSSQDVLCTAVSCLRAAVGVFNEQHSISWQRFYIQERLCDCLYYGKAHAEGRAYRARLFRDQETLYGPFARNVLYTLTNVAADHLYGGDVDSGAALYRMALERAEHLIGLGRAKIRFVALEGLAQFEQIRCERMHQSRANSAGELPVVHLQNAYRHIDEAFCEAQAWFEQSNHRILRALERRTQIGNLLAGTGHQPPDGCLDLLDLTPRTAQGESPEASKTSDTVEP